MVKLFKLANRAKGFGITYDDLLIIINARYASDRTRAGDRAWEVSEAYANI